MSWDYTESSEPYNHSDCDTPGCVDCHDCTAELHWVWERNPFGCDYICPSGGTLEQRETAEALVTRDFWYDKAVETVKILLPGPVQSAA